MTDMKEEEENLKKIKQNSRVLSTGGDELFFSDVEKNKKPPEFPANNTNERNDTGDDKEKEKILKDQFLPDSN